MLKITLLPIGQRVTHFAGGPDTHGKGTIVAYNGIKPNTYAQSDLKSAVTIAAAADEHLKPLLLNAIADSFYDRTRCPYVVQWDVRTDDSDIAKKYPAGYKDNYEPDSIRAIKE